MTTATTIAISASTKGKADLVHALDRHRKPASCFAESSVPARGVQRFRTFGVEFQVRVDDPEAQSYLHNYLPYGSHPLAPGTAAAGALCWSLRRLAADSGWRVSRGRSRIADASTLRLGLEQLHQALLQYVSRSAEQFTFVHAGAVARKGRGLILPGDSFAGKSTLVRRLVEAGATYFSDDIAVIDSRGYLHPYARTLRFRQPGTIWQEHVPITDLVPSAAIPAGPKAVPVALVGFCSYREDADWRVEKLSPGNLALEGVRHSLGVRESPARHLHQWATLAAAAQGFRWTRGDARDAASHLLRALDCNTLPL